MGRLFSDVKWPFYTERDVDGLARVYSGESQEE